jgi:hypothetical protein
MFIERQHHPAIEFDPDAGQVEPVLAHYLSNKVDPFKSALPLLLDGAGQDDERVFMVESPLSELVDWTIELNRHIDFPERVAVDVKHRAFFEAVKRSLLEAAAKIDRIEYAALEEEEGDDA